MNQNPPLIKYPYLSHTRWRRTSAKALQGTINQSLTQIKDAVEKTSVHSQSLLSELPLLKAVLSDAGTDLKRVATEVNANTTAIKDMGKKDQSPSPNAGANPDTNQDGKFSSR